jgi:hypothetical protein
MPIGGKLVLKGGVPLKGAVKKKKKSKALAAVEDEGGEQDEQQQEQGDTSQPGKPASVVAHDNVTVT